MGRSRIHEWAECLVIRGVCAGVGLLVGYAWTQVEGDGRQGGASKPTGSEAYVAVGVTSTSWEEAARLSGRKGYDLRLGLVDEVPIEEIEACLLDLEIPYEIELGVQLLIRLAGHDGETAFRLYQGLELAENLDWTPDPA